MKASISFRENRSPIFRAKVPLNIVGLPFLSGVEAANSDDLCLSFSSLFDSGPMIKFLYRPNDSINPFGLAFKTGIGLFGSPINAPMSLTAEINLLGNHRPSFFLHFRPQVGDFAVKRSIKPEKMIMPFNQREDITGHRTIAIDGAETPNFSPPVHRIIEDIISDMNVTARTAFQVRAQTTVKLRWNVVFPADAKNSFPSRTGSDKMPYLALNKIGIELGAVKDGPERKDEVKKKVDDLQAEMASLRKNFDQLRSEITNPKASPMVATELSRRNTKENRP